MENQDEMESLYAQMEREYEEEEMKKKASKKGGKKGGGKAAKEESTTPATGDNAGGGEGGEGAPKVVEAPSAKAAAAAKKKDKKPAAVKESQEKKQDEKENDKPSAAKETKPGDKGKTKDAKEVKTEAAASENKEAEKKDDKSTTKTEEASGSKKTGKDAKGGDKAPAKKKAGVSALKEALEAAKKKEEELIRAEEEKQRKEEEARRQKEEQERLERERKQKKKQKEKERIQKMKQEGRYETKEQKEARQRALIQLQALGAKIPTTAAEEAEAESAQQEAANKARSKPKYERVRKGGKQGTKEEGGADQQKEDESKTNGLDEASQLQEQQQEEERIKDNWDDDDDVKDEWDAESKTSSRKSKSTTASGSTATAGSKATTTTTTTTTSTNAGNANSEEDESSEELSDDSEDEDEEESEEESEPENKDLPPVERARLRLHRRHEEAEKHRSVDNLRCPVICVLGHVDTGKTKILDNLRRTRVQEDEAGGITQQIGATNVPLETVQERTKMCRHVYKELIKIPGLLIIDTPGHESFKSLRSRGSSLCDIAILVVDIMHGLEPQTIESINILKEKKTPFVVALNKIDRLFGWKTSPQADVVKVLESQAENTKSEFEKRTSEVIVQLAEQGLNAALYYRNPDMKTYISMVPTSAVSSDGIGNLMALIVDFAQTILAKRISYSRELQCTVMEVKEIAGLGTTIDVCLVNGKLKVCDTIVIPGQEGPIITQIRGLLLPQPNRELRVKNSYRPNKEVLGAQGVKIVGKNLEKAMAGLPLFVAHKDDEVEMYKEELQVMLRQALSSIRLSDTGVFVQASTLGSLEALLDFLRSSKIPYAGISIGPVHKKDVTIASIMLEKDPQYAVILAFDVKVEKDAQDIADHVGVKIFTADIIYHLFDKFMGYRDELKQKKREEFKDVAVFPFKLKIMPQFIFNTRDPIICGVKVEAGFLKIGSPVCALCEDPSTEREGKDKFVDLGRITSIEFNHKPLDMAKQGTEVCIRIENTTGGAPKLLGRHFLATDLLVSKISRDSIDAVKNYFREEMTKSDWQLIIELKKQFQIL